MPNPILSFVAKANLSHHRNNHRPFNPIIGFAHINFKGNVMVSRLAYSHKAQNFMGYKDIICDHSTFNKCTLIQLNDLQKDTFQMIGHGLGNNLIDRIA